MTTGMGVLVVLWVAVLAVIAFTTERQQQAMLLAAWILILLSALWPLTRLL